MRTHLKFRNFHTATTDAATELFEARPWREENIEQRQEIAQTFADKVCNAYHVPTVVVNIGPGGYWRTTSYSPAIVQLNSMEQIESMSPPTITLAGWSIINLFVAVRTHLLANGTGDGEPVAWAHSLFYAVKPAMFRARVREGRIQGLTAKDTFSAATWNLLVGAEAGDDDTGNLLVDPGEVTQIIEQIREGTYVPAPMTDPTATEGELTTDGEDDEDEDEGDVFEADDSLPDELETDEPDEDETVSETGNVLGTDRDPNVSANNDGLDALNIVALRRLSRGVVSGGYSMSKPELIAALRRVGVTA